MSEKNTRGGKRAGAGRPPEADPRKPLPFRLRESVIVKAKRMGRDNVESLIEKAKEVSV